MFQNILNRILSFGINDAMEQSKVNQVQRINLFYLFILVLLLVSILWALFTGHVLFAVRDIGFLGGIVAINFLVPVGRKTNLNSLLGLIMLAGFFLTAFLIDFGISPALILALYLLFPLVAASINPQNWIYVAIGLGLSILVLDLVPATKTHIHLKLYDAVIFFTIYTMIVLLSDFIEKTNRKLFDRLKDSRSEFESKVVEKDEFISKLSHKLRTSLSNIALINNLVHDSRLSSEQKELVETLKASTNTLIEDVNNIVEIASPGIVDYKKSIISFDLNRVLDDAIGILESGTMRQGELKIDGLESVSNFLIGDPSLVRSLVINITKGLSLYRQSHAHIVLSLENLRETPSQVRVGFSFFINTELQEDLISYLTSLKLGEARQSSDLSRAHALLQESESSLNAIARGRQTTISFFLDFAKDATRTVALEEERQQKEVQGKKSVALQKAKVLLVEDNEINQKIVLLSLSKRVSQIDVATNGKEALEMFGLKQYDIILMDIMMPVMDGLTATKKIREIESTNDSHVPIITITANALAGDRDTCLAAGADEYIAKPFQADVLIKKMKNLLA